MSGSLRASNSPEREERHREILYIGNMFSGQGRGVTVIETLSNSLRERYIVHAVSGKRGKLARLTHMLVSVIRLRGRVSIVLIDTYSTLNFYYALLVTQLCRLLRLPYIPILHGGNLPARLARSPRLSRSIFRHSRINVAPSDYLGRAFSGKGYPVVSIPNSIQMEDYPFTRRASCRVRLLYVRAFARIYNPEMAIRTLHRLTGRYPDAELCMVGPDRDGTLARCRTLCEQLGLGARVRFTGQLEKSQWHRLSAEYDIFINTSDFDNMPVSVVEAMALGLPVVSTDPGGMPDLVTHRQSGLLVSCGDDETMAESISWLVEQPLEAARLADNARNRVAAFDWAIVRKQWFELLG